MEGGGGYDVERGLRERCHPVLIPEEVENLFVEGGFKVRYVKGVILICVDAKVFNFVEGDGLVFTWFGVRGNVLLWIRSEGTDIDFSRCNGPMWVNLTLDNQIHVSGREAWVKIRRRQQRGPEIVDFGIAS
jgi:hypothetical protein